MNHADLEAYVTGVDFETVIQALRVELGTLTLDCVIDTNQRIFASDSMKIIITTGVQDGFTSVWIRETAPWKSNVELARFLARQLNCRARCDPGDMHSHVNPRAFLEIVDGQESIIEWT